jgi:hypothetical protein
MKEAIAPCRLRPKSEGLFLTSRGVFVSFIIETCIFWVQLKLTDISTKLTVKDLVYQKTTIKSFLTKF